MKKKILWISPRWPEPANDGAKIATVELLRGLANSNQFEITFLAFLSEGEPSPPIPEVPFQATHIIRKRPSSDSPFVKLLKNPFIPITFNPFLGEKIHREFQAVLRSTTWDIIFFDGAHAAIPMLTLKFNKKEPYYYRAHNAEYVLWERTALQNKGLKKLALHLQAYLVKRFEEDLVRACKMTFPVSSEDGQLFKKLDPHARIKVIRIGQPFPDHPPIGSGPDAQTQSTDLQLGFVGRIDWLPNQQGLEWFLKNVWPKMKSSLPTIRLQIAGSGNSSWLAPYQGDPQIKLLGKVERLEEFYKTTDLAIVPLFIGSGTRVKVIEASRYAVPCLSTALGVEGCGLIEGESYLKAETEQQWIDCVQGLNKTALSEIGKNAFLALKPQYDTQLISQQLVQALLE